MIPGNSTPPEAGAPAAVAGLTRCEQLEQVFARVLADQLTAVPGHSGELTYELAPERLLKIAAFLRDAPELKFEMCMDVCGVDYLEYGRAEWTTVAASSSGFSRGVSRIGEASESIDDSIPSKPAAGRRYAVIYHLLSVSLNQRVRLRVFCPDDAEPIVDSVTGIWASADWFEREVFDLFGILFRGHPDLRRILTDYGFIGHPFRKDFPLSGNVEVRYDPEKGRVVYEPVTIEPRILVPKVIRDDNRYDAQLTNASAAAPTGKPNV